MKIRESEPLEPGPEPFHAHFEIAASERRRIGVVSSHNPESPMWYVNVFVGDSNTGEVKASLNYKK